MATNLDQEVRLQARKKTPWLIKMANKVALSAR